MVHDGAGVRLTISREAAEQVTGATCGIRPSGRAKDLLSLSEEGRGELGIRKLSGKVTQWSSPISKTGSRMMKYIIPCVLRSVATLTVPGINFGAARVALSTATDSGNNARTESRRACLARHFPCCVRVGLLDWPLCRTCCISLNGSAAQPTSPFSQNGQY